MQRRSSGLTVLELLIAAGISMLIMGAALATALSSRALLISDQTRMRTNEDLRSALAIVGNDVQLAGERLGGESTVVVPGIEIAGGNTLILRRNVSDTLLAVCFTGTGALPTSIPVAIRPPLTGTAAAYPGCTAIDANADGYPDNLSAWRSFRTSHGNSVRAYLYNPTQRVGEFITYTGEETAGNTFSISRSSDTLLHTYPIEEYPTLYLIEERRYALSGDVLTLTINEERSNIQNVVNRLRSFQATAVVDGVRKTSFTNAENWKTIDTVEVTVTGANGRRLTSQFFPRNTLSY